MLGAATAGGSPFSPTMTYWRKLLFTDEQQEYARASEDDRRHQDQQHACRTP